MQTVIHNHDIQISLEKQRMCLRVKHGRMGVLILKVFTKYNRVSPRWDDLYCCQFNINNNFLKMISLFSVNFN